ncbi:MAG: cyclomaltodextrinase C-terminal domain-containing protein, partial [Gammaproteobacteria bacterium]|nr:cyclomaltodextrinase C-terminal domain-containing protein [Gammaproteobacteria bacterium]
AGFSHATDVLTGNSLSLGESLQLPPRSVRVLDLD